LVCWSIAAAKVTSLDSKYRSHHQGQNRVSLFSPRHRATYLFAAMFLALTILLGVRLNEWAPDAEPGRCYDSHLLTSPSAGHPHADLVYVGCTAAWMLAVMGGAAFIPFWRHKWLLTAAFLQFPVHFYSMVVLRVANGDKLKSDGEGENGWDFGQTTAVLLLALAFQELLKKGLQFRRVRKELLATGGRQEHRKGSETEQFSSSERRAEEGQLQS